MTDFKIIPVDHTNPDLVTGPIDFAFARPGINKDLLRNWPVVYTLNDATDVYVGETRNAEARLKQHQKNREKNGLNEIRVIVDKKFNKSAALDLESFLIRLFSGDGKFRVLNRNSGITDSDYYNRAKYQERFNEIFQELYDAKLFTRSIEEIQNADLYKFSPFKAPNEDQAVIGSIIVEQILESRAQQEDSEHVIQGSAGTGKTILAIYLLKLLRDIQNMQDEGNEKDEDTQFSEYFTKENQALLDDFRVGLVIPQGGLRETLRKVFKHTPGLEDIPVLSTFDAGESKEPFDLLIVDEAHRLGQRANQPAAALNIKFKKINETLFNKDDNELTQLDWVRKQSQHRILLIDGKQTVMPGDIGSETVSSLFDQAKAQQRFFELKSQMRVKAGTDYLGFIRKLLNGEVSEPAPDFGDRYDFGIFTDLKKMRDKIYARENEFGLSRLVAGYAWEWKSRADKSQYDISEGGLKLRWNTQKTDWVNSENSVSEVGSIHTIQGYDLNYAGVLIGRDLYMDPETQEIRYSEEHYFDKKGKENNLKRKIKYSPEDILEYIKNIYSVLLTRGILGTYVYVCDETLRDYFLKYLPRLD